MGRPRIRGLGLGARVPSVRLLELIDKRYECRDVVLLHGLERRLRLVGVEEFDLHLRSEEHTSELQSQSKLVCRLLLEKKKSLNSIRALRPRLQPDAHTRLVEG